MFLLQPYVQLGHGKGKKTWDKGLRDSDEIMGYRQCLLQKCLQGCGGLSVLYSPQVNPYGLYGMGYGLYGIGHGVYGMGHGPHGIHEMEHGPYGMGHGLHGPHGIGHEPHGIEHGPYRIHGIEHGIHGIEHGIHGMGQDRKSVV